MLVKTIAFCFCTLNALFVCVSWFSLCSMRLLDAQQIYLNRKIVSRLDVELNNCQMATKIGTNRIKHRQQAEYPSLR